MRIRVVRGAKSIEVESDMLTLRDVPAVQRLLDSSVGNSDTPTDIGESVGDTRTPNHRPPPPPDVTNFPNPAAPWGIVDVEKPRRSWWDRLMGKPEPGCKFVSLPGRVRDNAAEHITYVLITMEPPASFY